MQLQTDFSHPLKLNCSSIASSSTPGNNASFPDGQLIKFEQFNNESDNKNNANLNGHKKRLTIQINDSYDFNQSSMNHSEIAVGVQSATTDKQPGTINFFKKHLENQQGSNYCIGESQSPSFANSQSQLEINKILSYNSFLQQKIKELQTQNQNIHSLLNSEKSQVKTLKSDNQSLKLLLKKKQEALYHEKQRNNKLSQKIAQLQQQRAQHVFYDQKLRQKESKIQQLQRKIQKMTAMNKAFQKELKQSDRKIMDLEKDLQKTFCQNQQQVISRIKESSVKVKEVPAKSKQLIANKQNQNNNIISNNMGGTLGSTMQLIKSIDKKKGSQSQGKKKQPLKITESNIRNQRTSSSSNIVAKKLLNLKKQ